MSNSEAVTEYIEQKNWKALSITMAEEIKDKKIAARKKKELEITCYSISNSKKIKNRTMSKKR